MATNRLITMSPVDIYIGVTTNVGNTYTAGSPPVGGYAANILYACTFNATNTGASTLDGYIIQRNGAALVGGEIGANSNILLLFTGILFQLMNYATVPPGTVLVVTATSPVISSGGTSPNISLPVATTSVDGYLAHGDWNTFNNKVTSVTASSPLASSGGVTPNITAFVFAASGASHASGIVPDPGGTAGTTHFLREDATWAIPPTATASIDGYLSHIDWSTFNGKQNALGYTAANDASVVHLAGAESITGAKTFTVSIAVASTSSAKCASFVCSPLTVSYITVDSSDATQSALLGANGGAGGYCFVGSLTNTDLVFRTNNTEHGRISSTGAWTIGASIQSASFAFAINALGTVGATGTCNFTTSALNTLTLTSATNCTISFTAPPNPCEVTVIVSAPVSGTVPTQTWPATVNGTPAAVSILGKRTINVFQFDGTRYWLKSSLANQT